MLPRSLQMNLLHAKSSHQFEIFAKNIAVTNEMKERLTKKVGKVLSKLGNDAVRTHVVLRFDPHREGLIHPKQDSFVAEVTVTFRGGGVAHAKEGTDNIYASIDLVAHKIARAIKRHNGRSRDKSRQQKATVASDILASEDTEESTDFDISELISDLDTHYVKDIDEKESMKALKLVRPKKITMPPITIDDALIEFELIDHPFYVFRNKDTMQINVIYRRKDGTAGLIMPEE
jgi:putative sigma-54 modulation protein